MLKLKEQVCSLELAKRLKELNCKQESLFRWVTTKQGGKKYIITKSQPFQNGYSAYTSSELGTLLPAFNPDKSAFQQLTCVKNRHSGGDEFSVRYTNHNRGTHSDFIFFADTLTDALAKMLIYLKENKLI